MYHYQNIDIVKYKYTNQLNFQKVFGAEVTDPDAFCV